MKSFVWDKNYVTGVANVDAQHQELVDLINEYSASLANNSLCTKDTEDVLQELLAYTVYHFDEEESLMQKAMVDPRHIAVHKREHKKLIDEALLMRGEVNDQQSDSSKYLLDFLIHWLAYHILGLDQTMARQIEAMKSGYTSEQAYEKQVNLSNDVRGPLLAALSALFSQVSERNQVLMELTNQLEKKVHQRTLALENANFELDNANKELEALATTDPLTGLPNRRFAMRELENLWQDSQFSGALSCMMIDADNFKVINDTEGHDAGDCVLLQLAETLKDNLRTDDIASRLGGDEFLIICPNADKEEVHYLASNLLNKIQSLRVKVGLSHWQGSVSIGLATLDESMGSIEGLIKCADLAVYKAKANGKNRVEAF
jgi:hemerythrin